MRTVFVSVFTLGVFDPLFADLEVFGIWHHMFYKTLQSVFPLGNWGLMGDLYSLLLC